MTDQEIRHALREMKNARRAIKRAEAKRDAMRDLLTEHMTQHRLDELLIDDWTLQLRSVEQSRLDTEGLRKALPDVCSAFTRTTSVQRFTATQRA